MLVSSSDAVKASMLGLAESILTTLFVITILFFFVVVLFDIFS